MIKLLILGVTALIYYKNSDVSVTAPNVLLVIGGVISIIPFLGWIGGILTSHQALEFILGWLTIKKYPKIPVF